MAKRPPKTGLAKAVVEARKAIGLSTQEQLADAAGLSIATIKNIESGVYGEVKSGTAEALAKGLKLSVPELWRRAGHEPDRPELALALERFPRSWWNTKHLARNAGGEATREELAEILKNPPTWLDGDGINDEAIARCVELIRATRPAPTSAL